LQKLQELQRLNGPDAVEIKPEFRRRFLVRGCTGSATGKEIHHCPVDLLGLGAFAP
jgi:hypothetical protein